MSEQDVPDMGKVAAALEEFDDWDDQVRAWQKEVAELEGPGPWHPGLPIGAIDLFVGQAQADDLLLCIHELSDHLRRHGYEVQSANLVLGPFGEGSRGRPAFRLSYSTSVWPRRLLNIRLVTSRGWQSSRHTLREALASAVRRLKINGSGEPS